MPLSINVGLSRKASENFQSMGVSINVTAELDQALLARPDELQQQIDALYRQAQFALDRHAGQPEPQQQRCAERPPARPNDRYGRPNPNGGGDGRGYRNGNGRNGGMMTDSQRRAINAIANRLGIDPHVEAREVVGELDQLTIRQASDLIDHLKAIPNGNGR
jgi:hypothetical protein